MKWRRILPEMCASTWCPFGSSTLNIAFGRGSLTTPSTSIASFLGIRSFLRSPFSGLLLYQIRPPDREQKVLSGPGRALWHRQHLRLAFGHRDRMLEVRRPASVDGRHRPVVLELARAPVAHRHHGLKRQHHALFQHRAAVGGPEVGHLGLLVHLAPDAVPDVLAHDAEAVLLDVRLDRVGYLAEPLPGAQVADPLGQRLARYVNKLLRLGRALPDDDRDRGVGDEPLVRAAEVEADDIAFLQHALAGDAVHDLLVDGDADRGRIAVVPEERRLDTLLRELLAHDLVELLYDEAGPQLIDQLLERAGDDAACMA